MTVRSFIGRLATDARFYHVICRAGRPGQHRLLPLAALRYRGLWLLTGHRITHFSVTRRNLRSPLWWLARLSVNVTTYFSALLCRSEIRGDCHIGDCVYLSNRGYLICGADSIGSGSVIHDHCTFGYAVAEGKEGRPKIGQNVWVGPNCIIAGELSIGDGATILPGSFLTYSVPAGALVGGNPARIVRGNFDNSTLRSSLDPAAGTVNTP